MTEFTWQMHGRTLEQHFVPFDSLRAVCGQSGPWVSGKYERGRFKCRACRSEARTIEQWLREERRDNAQIAALLQEARRRACYR